MWIKTIVLVCCVIITVAVDEHRPKKNDDRGKRNLQYHVSHHYSVPQSYRLERRISTGPQIPLYHQSQLFPGPRSYSPYHKGRHSIPPPPYAVQMEPLVHYSQRDPLFDTNFLSLNTDHHNEDLLSDNNHITENTYGPPKHVIERPVYIKEPEPIIEIIIKESNVTLPPPPAPPTPPPKKKEQVQVFYVKYKKNPNGHGKDSIIYDKPIPAISPPIEDEHEESPPENYHHHHQEVATAPPPPSTTLRTIIRPDSETYHSPSGVKVTFGKEGFDYDKRSPKAQDAVPQARQLSSFPSSFSRRPPSFSFNNPPVSFRQPQPYRPFNQFRPTSQNYPSIPTPQQYSTLPKELQQFPPAPSPPRPSFSRQPVPYQPFEHPRQPQPIQFRPQPHFPITQKPEIFITQKPESFNQFPPQVRHQVTKPKQFPPPPQYHEQSRQPLFSQPPQFHQPYNFQQPQEPSFPHQRPQEQNFPPQSHEPSFPHQRPQEPSFPPQSHETSFQRHQEPSFPQLHESIQRPQELHESRFQGPQEPQALHHLQPQHHQEQSFIPPGGELIQSLPKYEQHISVQEPTRSVEIQPQSSPASTQSQQPSNHISAAEYNAKIQQQLKEANALQDSIRQSYYNPQQAYYTLQQSQQFGVTPSTTARPVISSSTPTTTTTTTTPKPTTKTPSTTTKDPKVLNAQLPDEVPDELREQLLSSGILNHADISVLDYDKVGDIPLSALPPDQLANFYSAGGAQQLQAAGSVPIPQFQPQASELREVRVKPEVQMKVVRYDPQSDQGQLVQNSYVQDDATQIAPVVLNDQSYNRYLPLKVSGAQFPIPDVPELKGRKISSVVVLAPVSYDFSAARKTRETSEEQIELLEGSVLKELLLKPTLENFNRFLESENRTSSDKQAVILLVTGSNESTQEKEIFMYDVATKTVSKLSGELSSAFVDAAEANSVRDTSASASNIVETRVPYPKPPIIDPERDLDTEASEHLETFIDVSGVDEDDLTAIETRNNFKTGPLPSSP